MSFNNRQDAGVRLAARLEHLRARNPIVLGLPRGGVPVAAIVADALDAPLDVIVVRKLGAPQHPEYAIGAIGAGGARILNESAMSMLGVSANQLAEVERVERQELARRTALFRGNRGPLDLMGRTAVIVDDGLATGSTAAIACRSARALGSTYVVLAVPVAPRDWTDGLIGEADEFIAVETHSPFHAVALWYVDFSQTTDQEVIRLLENHPPHG